MTRGFKLDLIAGTLEGEQGPIDEEGILIANINMKREDQNGVEII